MLSVKINLMTENETPERGGMDRINKSLQNLLDIYDRPVGMVVLKLTGKNFPKSVIQKAGVWSFLLQMETSGCMNVFRGLKCRATLVTKKPLLIYCLLPSVCLRVLQLTVCPEGPNKA